VLVISLFYGVLGFECVLLVCFVGFQIFSVFFVGGFSKCLSAFVGLVSILPLVLGVPLWLCVSSAFLAGLEIRFVCCDLS